VVSTGVAAGRWQEHATATAAFPISSVLASPTCWNGQPCSGNPAHPQCASGQGPSMWSQRPIAERRRPLTKTLAYPRSSGECWVGIGGLFDPIRFLMIKQHQPAYLITTPPKPKPLTLGRRRCAPLLRKERGYPAKTRDRISGSLRKRRLSSLRFCWRCLARASDNVVSIDVTVVAGCEWEWDGILMEVRVLGLTQPPIFSISATLSGLFHEPQRLKLNWLSLTFSSDFDLPARVWDPRLSVDGPLISLCGHANISISRDLYWYGGLITHSTNTPGHPIVHKPDLLCWGWSLPPAHRSLIHSSCLYSLPIHRIRHLCPV